MHSKYNLITEEWIPCILSDGEMKDLNLKDTLIQSHVLREVSDQSPLITAGLHRLLLAILHRNFGPKNQKEWKKLREKGKFDEQILTKYFTKWGHRFDLFDEDRPFYQTPGFTVSKKTSIAKIAQELSSGNNPALFDHSRDERPTSMQPSEAVRYLIGSQAYDVRFGNSSTIRFRNSPMVSGAMILIKGKTLFDTLILNLIRYDPKENEPVPASDDKPSWEREYPDKGGTARPADGYLDYLTWQSRAIRMLPEKNGNGTTISWCYFAQGVQNESSFLDPMKGYVKREERGMVPIGIQVDKELWRDCESLLRLRGCESRPPASLNWVALFVNDGTLERTSRFNLDVFGLATDKRKSAKILMWRHTRLPLPLELLHNTDLVDMIKRALESAEAVAKELKSSIGKLTMEIKISNNNWIIKQYWSRLQVPFFKYIIDLSQISEEMDQEEHHQRILDNWMIDTVIPIARESFEIVCDGLPNTAKGMKISALTRKTFQNGLISIKMAYTEVSYEKQSKI